MILLIYCFVICTKLTGLIDWSMWVVVPLYVLAMLWILINTILIVRSNKEEDDDS